MAYPEEEKVGGIESARKHSIDSINRSFYGDAYEPATPAEKESARLVGIDQANKRHSVDSINRRFYGDDYVPRTPVEKESAREEDLRRTVRLPDEDMEAEPPVGQEGVYGGIEEAGRGLVRTAQVAVPEMVGKAAEYFDPEGGSTALRDWGVETQENAKEWLQENPEYKQSLTARKKKQDDAFSVHGSAGEAMEMIGPSLAPSVGGAAIGAVIGGAIGSVVPGAGTMAGAGLGAKAGAWMGSAASLAAFFGSAALDTEKKVTEAQIKAGIPEEQAKEAGRVAGWKSGSIEAGGELVSKIPVFQVLRLLPSSAKKNTVLAATKTVKSPTATINDLLKVVGTEVATELGQGAGQQYVEAEAGAGEMPTWDSTKGVIMPTILMSALTYGIAEPIGMAQRNALTKTLSDKDAPEPERIKAVYDVASTIKNDELKALWLDHSLRQVQANAPVVLADDVYYANEEARRVTEGRPEQEVVGTETQVPEASPTTTGREVAEPPGLGGRDAPTERVTPVVAGEDDGFTETPIERGNADETGQQGVSGPTQGQTVGDVNGETAQPSGGAAEPGPGESAQGPVTKGSRQRIMNTDSIFDDYVPGDDGVNYELYKPADGKAPGGFVRVVDESGEVVSETSYRDFDKAKAEFAKSTRVAGVKKLTDRETPKISSSEAAGLLETPEGSMRGHMTDAGNDGLGRDYQTPEMPTADLSKMDAKAKALGWEKMAGGVRPNGMGTSLYRITNPNDRRTDAAKKLRAEWDSLDPDQQFERATKAHTEARTSPVSGGLPNKLAYTESEKKASQVFIDVDSLKFINDKVGHQAGDELLRTVGAALTKFTQNAYHISGDEFVIQADSNEEAAEIMNQAQDALENSVLIGTKGDKTFRYNPGVSYVIGKTIEGADEGLTAEKERREAAGKRAGRGEQPPGMVVRSAKGDNTKDSEEGGIDEDQFFDEEINPDTVEKHHALKDKETMETLRRMASNAGWTEQGGGRIKSTRTGSGPKTMPWIPLEEWFARKPAKVTEKTIKGAVARLDAGTKLTKPMREAIAFMLGELQAAETSDLTHGKAVEESAGETLLDIADRLDALNDGEGDEILERGAMMGSDDETIRDQLLAAIDKQEAPPATGAEVSDYQFVQALDHAMVFKQAALQGYGPIEKKRMQARFMDGVAKALWHKKYEARTHEGKAIEEVAEAAFMRMAQSIAGNTDRSSESRANDLDIIANAQPAFVTRVGTSSANQAYSTPVNLSFAAMRMISATDNPGVVYDPTAGTGALLITADRTTAIANELNPERTNLLTLAGQRNVTTNDATKWEPDQQVDVVATNPPFGKKSNKATLPDGSVYGTTKLEHGIAMRALAKMKDDGKAVIIVGGPNPRTMDHAGERAKHYKTKEQLKFNRELRKWYHVTGHFTAAGNMYKSQGAAWPVDVYTIVGRRSEPLEISNTDADMPHNTTPKVIKTPEELNGLVQTTRSIGRRIIRSRIPTPKGPTGVSTGAIEPDVSSGAVKPGSRSGSKGSRPDTEGSGGGTDRTGKSQGAGGGGGSGRPAGGVSGGSGPELSPGEGGKPGGGGSANTPTVGEPSGGDVDLGSMFDRLLKEKAAERGMEEPKPAPPPAPEGGGPGAAPARSAKTAAKTAATESAAGLKAMGEGFFELFGTGNGTLNSGLTFSEETYAKAKPLFKQAMEHFGEAARSIEETMGLLIDYLLDQFNDVGMVRNMKPYVERFIEEVNSPATKKDVSRPAAPAGQKHYPAASTGKQLGTLVPEPHEAGVTKALAAISDRMDGNVDEFVQDKLGYKSVDEMHESLAAEQVDALALAIDSIDNGQGFVVADQTGIGKGRFVASMIEYARKQGLTPIFMTEKPNLYVDMIRDLEDIGVKGFKPFITNAGIYGKGALVLPDGSKLARPKGGHNKNMRAAAANWKGSGYDAVFTTYDQMNTTKGRMTDRHNMIDTLAPNAMFILDESHNAGGTGKTEKDVQKEQDRGIDKLPREILIRRLLGKAKGAVFSSATWAKRPQTMSLYGANTDLSLLGENMEELFSHGGVPLQQAVSSLMVESGQLIRREKSYEGIEFDTAKEYKVSTKAIDAVAASLMQIRDFDNNFAGPLKEAMAEALGPDSEQTIASVGFGSVMHNLFDQAFTGLKADQIADNAIEVLARGEKLVIGIANTNETALKELMEKDGLSVGSPVDFTLKDLFRRYLRNTLRYNVKQSADPNGKGVSVWIDPATLEGAAQTAWDNALAFIDAIPAGNAPGSPIDHIKTRIKAAGFRMGEITGRGTAIDSAGKIYVRSDEETSIQGRKRTIDRFNGGDIKHPVDVDDKLDGVIINQSGATGVSMHSSEKFADQTPRTMILAQYEKNIDTFMQMLGRINRTGQTTLPRYVFPGSNIPAENRLHAVLRKKLISLNANVTGAGSSAVDIEVPDFMNKWGGRAAQEVLSDNPAIARKISLQSGEDLAEYIQKLTGHIGLLSHSEQDLFYTELLRVYQEHIDQATAMGINTGAMAVIPLDAKQLRRKLVTPATGDKPMQRAVYAYEVDAKLQSRPATLEAVTKEITKKATKNGKVKGDVRLLINQREASDWADTRDDYSLYVDGEIKDIRAAGKAKEKVARAAAKKDGKDEKAAADKVRLATEKRVSNKHKSLDKAEKETRDLRKLLGTGKFVSVTLNDTGQIVNGVVGDMWKSGLGENPHTTTQWSVKIYLAQAEPRQVIARLSDIGPKGSIQVAPGMKDESTADFKKAVEDTKTGRSKRVLVMGNTPAAFVAFRGLITQFTDAQGKIGDGILLPPNVTSISDTQRKALTFKKAEPLGEYLKESNEIVKFEDGVATAFVNSSSGQLHIKVAASMGAKKFRADAVVRDLKKIHTDFINVEDPATGRKVWRVAIFDPFGRNKETTESVLAYMIGTSRTPVTPDAQLGVAAKALGLGDLPAIEELDPGKSMVGDVPKYSMAKEGGAPQGMAVEDVRTELSEHFGARRIARMEAAGDLHIVESAAELPEGPNGEIAPDYAQGLKAPDNGVWINAAATANGLDSLAAATLAHEGTHASEKMVGTTRTVLGVNFKKLVRQLEALANSGDEAAISAWERIPEGTPEEHVASEFVAYFVEEAYSRIESGRGDTLSLKAKALYRRIMAAVKAWFLQTPVGRDLGFVPTDELMVALVRASIGRGPAVHAGTVLSSQRKRGSTRLNRGIDRLVADAKTMDSWKDWYKTYQSTLEEIFDGDADLLRKLLSATSQNATVAANTTLALKAYNQLMTGQPFTGYLPSVIKNLDKIRDNIETGGQKINAFEKANLGDESAVVIDLHITELFFNKQTPSKGQHKKAVATVNQVAAKLGWTPRQTQAALWAVNHVRRGTAPENIPSYEKELIKRADKIKALLAGLDAAGAGAGVSGRSQAAPQYSLPAEFGKSKYANVEKRLEHARTKTGIKESLTDRAKSVATAGWHEFTRAFPRLDKHRYGKVLDILRQLKGVPEYSHKEAFDKIWSFVGKMSKVERQVYTMNLVLPDMLQDIENGTLEDGATLPFGYANKAAVQADLANFEAQAAMRPEMGLALAARNEYMTETKEKLVEAKLLDKKVLDNDAYYHHQVLDYMALGDKFKPGTSSGDARVHKKGWQRARMGSSKEYNLEYLEAEFEVVAQQISQLEAKKHLDRIGEIEDIKSKLQAKASNANMQAYMAKHAWANPSQLTVAEIKADLGDDFRTWRDEIDKDTHTTWKPEPGTAWYHVNTVNDQIVEQAQDIGFAEVHKEEIGKAMAKGRDVEWVLPIELAETLDDPGQFPKEDTLVGKASAASLRSWKAWTLINPFRVFKYNLNNTSGDLDIALAFDYKILGYAKQAIKDLYTQARHPEKMSAELKHEMSEALRLQAIGSGFVVHDIEDFSKVFKAMTNPSPNWAMRYWGGAKGATNFRENVLRLAAFRYFKKRIAGGYTGAGASNKSEVDAITDRTERAAKLARELIGDYGNISHGGQYLRRHMIPFWSWSEINLPRYVRLIKNLKHEGASTGNIAGVMAWKATKLGIKMSAFASMVMLFNATVFPDEEDELTEQQRRQLHLILGRRENGSIRTIRIQGAFSDALSWFGAEDLPSDVTDLMGGKKTIEEYVQETAVATPSKLWQGAKPIEKTIAETVIGRTTYPDIMQPRPIRDRFEHATRFLSLGMPYRHLTGKPSRGLGEDLESMFAYSADPGEQAYYETRSQMADYLKKNGEESRSVTPTKRSNALYLYKQALKYGDFDAAEKYRGKYFELGGSYRGMNISVRRARPLSMLPRKHRGKFLGSLTAKERATYDRAQAWYRKTYLRRGVART